ncbi:MAG: rod shape-determining protein MreC, partial [Lysobacterales bacterium CG_4_9_14_3_um_filter_62_6]
MPPSVDSAPLFAEQASGSLRLIGYLALAAALMTADYRSAALVAVRAYAQNLSAPAYWLATAPVRLARSLRDASAERLELVKENAALREQLLRAQAGLTQSGPLQEENSRLRELLDARARLHLQAQ